MSCLNVSKMIQIGSTGINSGKTTIAKEIISTLSKDFSVFGIKIITIKEEKGKCHKGEEGCGICTTINSGYQLLEEKNGDGEKDTMLMLKSGCQRVFLLKAYKEHLLEGFNEFLKFVPKDSIIVCESNSIRNLIKPKLFIMMKNNSKYKKSAIDIMDKADLILDEPKLPDDFYNIYFPKK